MKSQPTLSIRKIFRLPDRDHWVDPMGTFGSCNRYRGDETIAPARHGLDKTRIVRRIAQRRAKFFDCRVQAIVEGNIGVRRPELLLNFFARNELAWTLKQHGQHLEGLV